MHRRPTVFPSIDPFTSGRELRVLQAAAKTGASSL